MRTAENWAAIGQELVRDWWELAGPGWELAWNWWELVANGKNFVGLGWNRGELVGAGR